MTARTSRRAGSRRSMSRFRCHRPGHQRASGSSRPERRRPVHGQQSKAADFGGMPAVLASNSACRPRTSGAMSPMKSWSSSNRPSARGDRGALLRRHRLTRSSPDTPTASPCPAAHRRPAHGAGGLHSLAGDRGVLARPNFFYTPSATASPHRSRSAHAGDPAQYALAKLRCRRPMRSPRARRFWSR